MSAEISNAATDGADGSRPFQLAAADVGGRAAVVVVLGGSAAYRLDDLLPNGIDAPDHLHELLTDWSRWHPVVAAAAAYAPALASAVRPKRWLPPVRPAKLICIGTNYRDHLREMGTPRAPELPY